MKYQFERQVKAAVKCQKIIYFSYWIAIIIGVLVGEYFLVDSFASLQFDAQAVYAAETIIILVTAAIIPLTLKLFGLKMNQKDWANTSLDDGIAYYNRWSTVRIALLGVVAVSALCVHYLFMSAGAGFCTLIISFATFFCIPSKKKLEGFIVHHQEEIEQNESDEVTT